MIHNDNLRPVDVAILYGLGQKDRAQYIARKLRPPKLGVPNLDVNVSTSNTPDYEFEYINGWDVENQNTPVEKR